MSDTGIQAVDKQFPDTGTSLMCPPLVAAITGKQFSELVRLLIAERQPRANDAQEVTEDQAEPDMTLDSSEGSGTASQRRHWYFRDR